MGQKAQQILQMQRLFVADATNVAVALAGLVRRCSCGAGLGFYRRCCGRGDGCAELQRRRRSRQLQRSSWQMRRMRQLLRSLRGASNFVPRGSAQAAARFARQPCQRLHVATTLRRGERLSPRAPKFYRPSSAQVNFRRTPVGNLQIVYPPTPEVLTLARKFTEEEEVEAEVSPELQAISQEEAQEVSPKETASPGAGGVLDLQDHLRDIWLMYHPQEDTEEADEKDKALLLALHGPDEEDKEEALLNEMKLLKTGEDSEVRTIQSGAVETVTTSPAKECRLKDLGDAGDAAT
ncbi:unnamed protein product [Effrenium voratum]|uniref:Uncharacterized protein n=1 Tax=Effrenium voratum TaxID=2562239 RepID=A0AA36MMG1_9DINO|nr:unnamed protein product [Effrenium voratum]